MSQFLEVIEHYDPTGQEIAYRFPPDGSADVKWGAQLIVHEAQEAVFYRDGRALDVFGPGRHTLTTQNIPLLTKLLAAPFGFTSPFRVQVVFVSRRTFLDQKWGTREPVVFRDRELGVVRLRAFGTYAYRIGDPRTFVNTIVGSLGQFDTARLQDFYRDMIVSRLNDLLGENLTSVLDLPASYDELAALAKARLTEDFGKYGVDLSDFYVNSITPPDEVLQRLDERASMGAVGDLGAYTRFKAAVALGDAAKGGGAGGNAGAGLGVGLGAGFGVQMASALGDAMRGTPVAPAAAAGGGAAAAGGFCAACGAGMPAGARFCPGCGKPLATNTCARCQQPLPAGAKFCPACGAPA
ncbi:MAG: SPFH domain-containing protein [Thermoanaerobaculaceae bacterium]|jgi:membrane protease subunit (stomatin/prohibitin family)|nr:SPFH domain-containing protein [Thermoanaerobaculaceae bacterium]